MSLSESIYQARSSVFTPSGLVSQVIVEEAELSGHVQLQLRRSGGPWLTMSRDSGAYCINTPDPSVEYSFLPVGLDTSCNVYIGP